MAGPLNIGEQISLRLQSGQARVACPGFRLLSVISTSVDRMGGDAIAQTAVDRGNRDSPRLNCCSRPDRDTSRSHR